MNIYRLFGTAITSLLVIGAIASETIIENSAPFSFPLTNGTISDNKAFTGKVRFGAVYRAMSGTSIDLSWSLPRGTAAGTIKLYSLKGALVRSFPITEQSGAIRWNIAEIGLAKGIYFARLSSVAVKKNHKIVIY